MSNNPTAFVPVIPDVDVVATRFTRPRHGTPEDMLRVFLNYCNSTEFLTSAVGTGLSGVRFEPSPVLSSCGPHQRFCKSYAALPGTAQLALAFHGTATTNVRNILHNGLDPVLRKGQYFGPGEYFSTDPSFSISYCRGGQEMVVFCVVVPERTDKNDSITNAANLSHPLRKSSSIVVVENNDHQIPLGVLHFACASSEAAKRSLDARVKLKQLSLQYKRTILQQKEAECKSKILNELLVKHRMDVAAEIYNAKQASLSLTSRREISMFVHRTPEDAEFAFLFEKLPEPMTYEEHSRSNQVLHLDHLSDELVEQKVAFTEALQKNIQAESAAATVANQDSSLRLTYA